MKRMMMIAASAILLSACNGTDPDDIGPDVGGQSLREVSHDMIVLGEQLEDPYSLKNMKDAVTKAYPAKGREVEIKPTDVYMRFLPKNENEYDRLVDAGLHLLDHPVDYRIIRDGDYYHDPSLDESRITWQYAVVPAGFKCPDGIESEILDECFIPDNASGTRAGNDIDWNLVERTAFELTGNADMLVPTTKASASPSGRITLVDADHNGGTPVGLAGVMISCNTFVKFATTYTDEEGYYQFEKKFSSDVRYRIVFKNQKSFAIGFNLLLVPASMSTMGTNTSEGVDLVIDSSSDHKLFARSVVNNAAYEYWQRCNDDEDQLPQPPYQTRIWLFDGMGSSSTPMLQQGPVIEGTLLSKYLGGFKDLIQTFMPDITIGLSGADTYKSIYSLTVHELAHASHFQQVGTDYWNKYISFIIESFVGSLGAVYGVGTEKDSGYCELGEMWAYYLENMMLRNRYGDDVVVQGTAHWFSPQILMYLDERGLTASKIFAAFTSDVINVSQLREKLAELYPTYESLINQAFDRYGKQ